MLMLLCICLHCLSTVCPWICGVHIDISREICSTFVSFDVRTVINIKFLGEIHAPEKKIGTERRRREINVSIAWFYAACIANRSAFIFQKRQIWAWCSHVRSPWRRETSHCEHDFATWQPHVEHIRVWTCERMKNVTGVRGWGWFPSFISFQFIDSSRACEKFTSNL